VCTASTSSQILRGQSPFLGEALAVHVDLPVAELARDIAEMPLERSLALVHDEADAEHAEDDHREREPHPAG
jgi:hypothetical protein